VGEGDPMAWDWVPCFSLQSKLKNSVRWDSVILYLKTAPQNLGFGSRPLPIMRRGTVDLFFRRS